jgi:hypothetical protein
MVARPDPARIEVLDSRMADVLREKTEAERLQIANQMWSSARTMLTSILRSEHPDWDEARVQREVARRMSHGSV